MHSWVQGIVELNFVEEGPNYLGLGYRKQDGECSKAKEAHEAIPRRNFISCSLPQACEVCVHDEWKILTPNLEEDVNKHATNENVKEEDIESSI